MAKSKPKPYRRPDGLYEKIKTVNGKRYAFRDKDPEEVWRQYYGFQEIQEDGPVFEAVAEEWEREHLQTVAHSTKMGYLPAYRRVKEEFGNKRIRDIAPQEIGAYIKRFSKTRGYKTTANELLVLRLIFDYGIVNGHSQINPAATVRVPKNLAREPREFPSDNDIAKVKANHKCTYGLLHYFILYTGCRLGEALAIQWQDIDFEAKEVTVSKSVYFENNIPKIKKPKTQRGIRKVILLDRLIDILGPIKGKPRAYLFEKDGSIPLFSQVVRGKNRYAKEIGITTTPHQLRHAFATMLFEAGIDAKTAQYLMGHAQLSTTMDIYTELRNRQLLEAAKKLNQMDICTEDTQ